MGIYPSGARAVFVFLLDMLDKLDEPGKELRSHEMCSCD
jgi:hypothetical protein